MGYVQNQFLLVRHTDTPIHEHVHVVINRVGLDGRTVSDSWDYMHSQAVIHELETQYGLTHAPLSWEKRKSKRNKAALDPHLFSEPPINTLPPPVQQQVKWQRQLRSHLNSALVVAWDWDSFSEQLAHQGVQLRLLHRQGKAVGISFRWQGQQIAGSRLGVAYSLPKLLAVMNGVNIPRGLGTSGMTQVLAAEQRDSEQPTAIRKPDTAQGDAIDDLEEAIHQFEPDETLPVAHQRYLQLVAFVQQQNIERLTQRQIDQEIAQWVLRAAHPEDGRALIYSPAVQRLRRQQGNERALDYLKALMREAQRQSGVPTEFSQEFSNRSEPER